MHVSERFKINNKIVCKFKIILFVCACLGNAGRLNASEEKKRMKSEQYSFGIDLERETGLCGDVRSPSMTNSLDGNRFCFVKEASCFSNLI